MVLEWEWEPKEAKGFYPEEGEKNGRNLLFELEYVAESQQIKKKQGLWTSFQKGPDFQRRFFSFKDISEQLKKQPFWIYCLSKSFEKSGFKK